MGLAVGGELPPIFVGIAEDEIDCAVGERSRRFYFEVLGLESPPVSTRLLHQTSSGVAMHRFAAKLALHLAGPCADCILAPSARRETIPTIDPERAHRGEKVCILWSQPLPKKKEKYAWSASGHSSRMCECRLLRVKPERRSKK